MKTAHQYEITDYGIENSAYFTGHGTLWTTYTHSALGCGDNYQDALENALEEAAEEGYTIALTTADEPGQPRPDDSAWDYHCRNCDLDDHENCESDLYYYVGLRWNDNP